MRKQMAGVAALVALAWAGQAMAAPPDPATCPRPATRAADTSGRTGPLAIPQAFAAIARGNHDSIAITTLGGATHCVDVRSMVNAQEFGLSSDGRFFSFRWYADEEGGYIVVDRSGRGKNADTGDRPMFSPSHRKFAAIEISESGFGSLNGFAVWQVDPIGFRRLAFLDNLPHVQDWRLDGWAGEACINLSAIPFGKFPANEADLPKVPRLRYLARPGARGWAVMRGSCPRA